MAPSANRRSGHSRRAQYSTFIAYSAGVLGAVIGAAFLLVSIFNPGLFSGARAMGAAAAEPGGEVLAGTRQSGRGVVASIEGYFRAGSQNARLKRELREAKLRRRSMLIATLSTVAVVALISGGTLQVVAEMLSSAGSWHIAFTLAPDDRHRWRHP